MEENPESNSPLFLPGTLYDNNYKSFRQAAENMQHELSLYQSGRKHYKDLPRGAAFNLFMDNIDELRHKRNELSLELEQTIQVPDKRITELLSVPVNKQHAQKL